MCVLLPSVSAPRRVATPATRAARCRAVGSESAVEGAAASSMNGIFLNCIRSACRFSGNFQLGHLFERTVYTVNPNGIPKYQVDLHGDYSTVG